MEIKFEQCDMPLNKESLKELSKISYIHFLLIESEKEILDGWKKINVKEKEIILLNYHPNAIILAHDIFYETCYNNNERIIGYCPLNFSEEHKSILHIV